MADTVKILGQSNPSAATATTLYQAPASTSVVVSSIVVANRSNVATTFRISFTPAGGTDDQNQQFTHYDVGIPGNETYVFTVGATLESAAANMAKIRVYATLATLSFTAFGVEIT